MKTTGFLFSIAALLIFATSASAIAIPEGSILVSTRLTSPGIVALDLNGNTVGGFTPQGTTYDVLDVQQIAPSGDILVAQHPSGEGDGDVVTRYDVNGNYIGTVTGTVSGQYTAHLTIADPLDGSNLAFIEHNLGGTISSIDLTTNAVVNTFAFPASGNAYPRGIVIGPDDFIYVAVENSGIWKIAQDLSPESYVQVAEDPAQNKYAEIAFGPDGMLYASIYTHDSIVRYDVTDGTVEDFIVDSDTENMALYAGIMFHPTTGNLLVSSYKTDEILEFNATTGDYIGVFANVTKPFNLSMAPAAAPIAGDANQDGKVDGSDVTILAGNWQVGVDGTQTANWGMGDFNRDGKVDGSDVTILAGNWQAGVTAAAAAVPEPSTLALILMGVISSGAMWCRRRR